MDAMAPIVSIYIALISNTGELRIFKIYLACAQVSLLHTVAIAEALQLNL